MRYNDLKIVETRFKEQNVGDLATQRGALDGSTRDLPIPTEIADPVLRLAPSLRQFVTYNSTYGIVGIKTVNGNTIRQLQQSLNRAGYDLQVDGQAGNNTRAAMIDIFYTIAAANGIAVSESLVREGPFDDVVDAAGGNPQPFDGSTPPSGTNVRANPDGSISRSNASQDNAQDNTQGLEAGPPYPQEDMDAVRSMQTKLEELGYSVGNTGIDGKYGPRTSRAVAAFKTDNNIQATDRGRSMSNDDLEKLNTAEPVENPTPTGNEGSTSSGSFDYGNAVPVDNLEPTASNFDGRESNAATIRFNNPGGMYPAGWQRRFGGTDTGERIGGGHRIAMFPDKVSGAAALFALLNGSLYVNKSVANAMRTWTGNNNAGTYINWLQNRGIDTNEVVGNFLANENSAIALASTMARWETGHAYPLSSEEWQQAYQRSGVGS